VSWILAFLGFAALILLHEAGHFTAAKAVGMRVERFSVFFPPLLWRFKRGETEYGIGAVPLGGYVKITGMNPAEQIPPEVAHRAYYRQPVWKRVVVIAAGPAVNILLAFLLLWGVFLAEGKAVPSTRIEGVERGQPAAAVLRPGDRVVAVDGVRGGPTAIGREISSHTCAQRPPTAGCRSRTSMRVTFLRDGRAHTATMRAVYDPSNKKTRIGVTFGYDTRPLGLVAAAGEGANQMWRVTSSTVKTIAGIFESSNRKQVGSVVGAYEVTRESFRFGIANALFLLAVVSLSLGIVNLFPFLPLDGGHIFWALAEKVRGRAIPFSVMERAGFIGFALVIGLFAIGLTNDVGRLTGQGFGLR
jgi:regulator of sigma E protease